MFDAIIVAGAHSRRLDGADKAAVEIGGRSLLRRAIEAVQGARSTVVVGPERPGFSVTWCRESPPDGGPVAAFAAGLEHTAAPILVLLAVDLPFVAPAVSVLLAALTPDVEAAVLVDEAGRANYLASAWRRDAAERALATLDTPAGASMRSMMDGVQLAEVVDRGQWSADCDTWQDIDAARRRAAKED